MPIESLSRSGSKKGIGRLEGRRDRRQSGVNHALVPTFSPIPARRLSLPYAPRLLSLQPGSFPMGGRSRVIRSPNTHQ
jgi:hypothetical protein